MSRACPHDTRRSTPAPPTPEETGERHMGRRIAASTARSGPARLAEGPASGGRHPGRAAPVFSAPADPALARTRDLGRGAPGDALDNARGLHLDLLVPRPEPRGHGRADARAGGLCL